MKLFITGGSGLLGSKIAEIALDKDYEIVKQLSKIKK